MSRSPAASTPRADPRAEPDDAAAETELRAAVAEHTRTVSLEVGAYKHAAESLTNTARQIQKRISSAPRLAAVRPDPAK